MFRKRADAEAPEAGSGPSRWRRLLRLGRRREPEVDDGLVLLPPIDYRLPPRQQSLSVPTPLAARTLKLKPVDPPRAAAAALPSRHVPPPPRRVPETPPRRVSVGDAILIAGGVALGVGSAFFPWYVFFNQDQFGVRAMRFEGTPSAGPVPVGMAPAGPVRDPIEATQGVAMELDPFPTGTLPDEDGEGPPPAPGLDLQPFPVPEIAYSVVHIANGRAMIEDDKGMFIVQRGSVLPDNATVAAIEQREGRWVVVTSDRRVLGIMR